MQAQLTLSGTTPLLQHNIALNDPDHEITRQIKAITDKRKKTDEDRRAIERLEWFGGLYLSQENGGGITVPARNVRRALIEAGKITRQGTQVQRGVISTTLDTRFEYGGPRDLDQLYARTEFSNRDSVGIGQKRVMRVRPQFPKWALTMDVMLLEDVIDLDDLQRIGERSGQAIGLGDNRTNGFGRFTFKVEQTG